MGVKLNTFIASFKLKRSDEEKLEMLQERVKNEYIPYEKKADVAKAIVDVCYWKTEKDSFGNEHKILHIDSVGKYMLICMSLIDLFTDIERSKGENKMLEEFNAINSNHIFDMLLQVIDPRELKEFNMVLDLTCKDLMTNEYENHVFIKSQIERFGSLIGTSLAPILDQIDLSKINEVINQIGG